MKGDNLKGSVNIQNISTADKCQHELLVSQPTRIIKHLDLFSGIGGFALAARNVWKERYRTIAFCEIDEFAKRVLRKNFGNVPIINDIHELRGDEFGAIDIITGGFPCQPFSAAGKRKGMEDERALFPQMLRVIERARPNWIVGENVAGLLTLQGGQVYKETISQLENIGYKTESFIIPASAVGAPHRRDRVWIVAYTESIRWAGLDEESKRRRSKINCQSFESFWRLISDIHLDVEPDFTKPSSGINRNDDGLPDGLDRLKGLGNAIVPQVAEVILAAIKAVDDRQSQTLQTRSG